MKIIVGLGNPGDRYAATKHNVGFMLIDAIADKLGVSAWTENFKALIAGTYVNGQKVLLVKPQTFMNLSGEAVRPIADYYKVDFGDLIVAHDDMDLPRGHVRLRPKGSSGGHRGVESIIQNLGGFQNFARVRIGVGRPPDQWTVNGHVLSPFNDEEVVTIKAAIEYLVPATLCIITDGIDMAMNKYNPKKKKTAEVSTDETIVASE